MRLTIEARVDAFLGIDGPKWSLEIFASSTPLPDLRPIVAAALLAEASLRECLDCGAFCPCQELTRDLLCRSCDAARNLEESEGCHDDPE